MKRASHESRSKKEGASPKSPGKARARSTESLKLAAPGFPEAMETEAFRSYLKKSRDSARQFKAEPASAYLKYGGASEDNENAARADWDQTKTPITAKRMLRPAQTPTPSVVSNAAASDTADIGDVTEVNISDDDVYSSPSDNLAKRLRGEPKRGRGRPETTGAYRIKKALMAEKAIRREISDEEVLDLEVDPKTLRVEKRPDKQTEELINDDDPYSGLGGVGITS